MPSCSATITYRSRQYAISVNTYWVFTTPKGKQSKYIFALLVDGYFRGNIARDENGVWKPLEEPDPKHLPFYQLVGEVIERELPECV